MRVCLPQHLVPRSRHLPSCFNNVFPIPAALRFYISNKWTLLQKLIRCVSSWCRILCVQCVGERTIISNHVSSCLSTWSLPVLWNFIIYSETELVPGTKLYGKNKAVKILAAAGFGGDHFVWTHYVPVHTHTRRSCSVTNYFSLLPLSKLTHCHTYGICTQAFYLKEKH